MIFKVLSSGKEMKAAWGKLKTKTKFKIQNYLNFVFLNFLS